MMPESNHTVLINVCWTRWIERIDGLVRIVEPLSPVMATFEDISLNRDALNDGNLESIQLQRCSGNDKCCHFLFYYCLSFCEMYPRWTRPLTVKLHKKAIKLLKAKNEVALLKKELIEMQNDIDARHHALYDDAVALGVSLLSQACLE
mgnify:FL=1